jgi:hypothetical protein
VRAAEILLGLAEQLSASGESSSCCNRTHYWKHTRILALHKIHELANQVPILALFLLPLTPFSEMRRVRMAELISDLIAIRFAPMAAQG